MRCVIVGGGDVILREEMGAFVGAGRGQVGVVYVGEAGEVDGGVLRGALFGPGGEGGSGCFVCCGEGGLVGGVVVPALVGWGFVEDVDLFGF